ncbi:fluoride efflux transporter FluC [Streptomyces clavuligerus]|uniref:Fluoride-specific ion channel FluC n=1 Tax=Streptomyces clavuligerus TaxID=1901 RepID=B5GT34_STRCL|nr:CrcB family protein [Streptomyces clavuligerus]ANW21922.1 camphor resistance protein CrcB [Streptomyces clavuligerus]AXU16551.1 CrcB family protein [Streptomyces clavuligerus]EDY49480.1 camphor resistance protein CrcB [Streptomyces clavuligerus]EFG08192.1 CrcB protein [Streptomyces clavuligerus]MBY6303626.1 CrcB family protein [Streptomyces clavuligerus]
MATGEHPPSSAHRPGGRAGGAGAAVLEAVDPDVDLRVPEQRAEMAGARRLPLLAVIAAGGVIGALARYALSVAWPWSGEGFPWTTLTINVSGSALMGVLMPLVTADATDTADAAGDGGAPVRRAAHPLVRPFAGVGVLGGFTTFSAYAGDFHTLVGRGATGQALLYAAGSVVLCVAAVWLTARATRAAMVRRAR